MLSGVMVSRAFHRYCQMLWKCEDKEEDCVNKLNQTLKHLKLTTNERENEDSASHSDTIV